MSWSELFSSPSQCISQRYHSLSVRQLLMREGLLRFARNDNIQYVIKGIVCVIARGFSEAISRFHNREFVVALLRYEYLKIQLNKVD